MRGPSLVLIGEAPGYRGCAITGVPFTARDLLQTDLGRWGLFAGRGFESGATLGGAEREITASVVWQAALEHLAAPPVTWNAFPFHPHPAGNGLANRSLTAKDLAGGQAYLGALLGLFPGVPVVAMGRQAERALEMLGVATSGTLRHPAHGGATAFASGLAALARRLRPSLEQE